MRSPSISARHGRWSRRAGRSRRGCGSRPSAMLPGKTPTSLTATGPPAVRPRHHQDRAAVAGDRRRGGALHRAGGKCLETGGNGVEQRDSGSSAASTSDLVRMSTSAAGYFRSRPHLPIRGAWRHPPSRSGSSGSGPSVSALKSAPRRPRPTELRVRAEGETRCAQATRRRQRRPRRRPRRRSARPRSPRTTCMPPRAYLERTERVRSRPRWSSSRREAEVAAKRASTSPTPRATARPSTSSRSAARPSTTPNGRASPRTRSTSSRSPSTAEEIAA